MQFLTCTSMYGYALCNILHYMFHYIPKYIYFIFFVREGVRKGKKILIQKVLISYTKK